MWKSISIWRNGSILERNVMVGLRLDEVETIVDVVSYGKSDDEIDKETVLIDDDDENLQTLSDLPYRLLCGGRKLA
ncbi:hypothetical protein Tco_0336368 [Tanacetum coccineum]